MKILIIIPAHNESKSIGELVSSIRGLGFPVMVIDDGSSDNTALLAKREGALVLSTNIKSGKGSALRLAFGQAIGQSLDAVITLDGDGQHSPLDLGSFVEMYTNEGADIINGNRMANPTGMPLIRRLTNVFMSWIISGVCHQEIKDTQCGYRLISTEVLRSIDLNCKDFEIETEILIRASKKKFRIVSIPIRTIYRDEISKIRPFKDTLRFVRYILKEISKK